MDSESFKKNDGVKDNEYKGFVSHIDCAMEKFYRWLRTGFVGRAFGAYGKADNAIFGSYGAVKPTSELRRRIAGSIENSGFAEFPARLIALILSCPLRIIGAFCLSCALTTAAMFFIALGLNSIPMFSGSMLIQTGNLWAGGIITVASIPLLFSKAPISYALIGGRLGRILFGDGVRLSEKYREYISKYTYNRLTVFLSVILGIGAGYCTRFISPVIITLAVILIPVIALTFVIPEVGAILTVVSAPILTVADHDGYILTFAVIILWAAYSVKLLFGKRSLDIRLIDLFVGALCVIIFTCGFGSVSGDGAIIYAARYAIILSAYFPLCNLLKNNGWGMRCINTLGISYFIVISLGVLSGFFGDFAVKWLNNGGLYEYAAVVSRINGIYSDPALSSCMSILAIPAILPKTRSKKSGWLIAYTIITVMALLLLIYFGGDVRAWRAFLYVFIIIMLIVSHRSATVILLGSVPAACIAINANSIMERFVKAFWTPVKNTVAQLFDFGQTSPVDFGCVMRMICDHPFGVGIGTAGFVKIYGNYTDIEIGSSADAGNFWLELLSETGIAGFIATAAILIMFIQLCISSLKHIYNARYARTAIIIMSSIIGMLIYGTYIWIWKDIEVFAVFWIILTLGVAILRNGLIDSLRLRNEQDSTFYKSDITIE